MYSVYNVDAIDGDEHFTFREKCSLFGCNVGFIPRLLRSRLPVGQQQPYRWHIPIRAALGEADRRDQTLVIDLKPKNRNPPLLSLFEVEDVWGMSADGWSPIMLRLRALFVDETSKALDARDFRRSQLERSDIVHTFLYLAGTIRNGRLDGKWTPPAASPTNSVLLWPEAWSYFASQVDGQMRAPST